MTTTVCKFRCVSKTETADGYSILLTAVTGGSKENERFFKYTPNGRLDLSIVNPQASANFTVGNTYMLTIEESAQ